MKHFLKIAEGCNVAPLLSQIKAHHELWNAYGLRKRGGSPHTEMSDIWVRYNDVARLDPTNPRAFNNEHVPVWYPAWDVLTELHPIIYSLMSPLEGQMIGGILITKIPPGGGIAPHTDEGWHVNYFDKFYLSLKSEPGANFVCDHDGVVESLNPKPGEIWRFDNRKRHWVENKSDSDRITAIICIRTDKFQ